MSTGGLQPVFFALTLGSAAGLALGNILEKVGLRHAGQHASLRTPLLFIKTLMRNAPWWGGLTLSALATLGYYAALGLYNISLVQPLMALNPMLTAVLGWWLLKERMTPRIALAILFVFAGLLLAGTQADEAPGVQSQWRLWIFAIAGTLALLTIHYRSQNRETLDALTMGAGFGMSAVLYKSLALDAVQLDTWTAAALWPLLLDLRLWAFAITYGTGFIYSQIALSRGRALYVIPFSAAVGTLIPIAAGALVYAEPFPFFKIASAMLVVIGSFFFVGASRAKDSFE